ncbi:MAG: hypothetical protein MK214_06730 [Thalassotalea sp.]|nr:hypothetical protein [Thalassotalea sp.]
MTIKKISQDKVKTLYQKLYEDAATPSTKQNLEHINKACQSITSTGAIVSPSAIITLLGKKGVIIAPRTIYYNKKLEAGKITNLYRLLIDGWIEHSETVNSIKISDKDLDEVYPESFVEDQGKIIL